MKTATALRSLVWEGMLIVFLLCADGLALASEPRSATEDFWISLPLELKGSPHSSGPAPVVYPIDFTELAAKLGVNGAVDERSIRLFSLNGWGKEVTEPVQFTPLPQPPVRERRVATGMRREVSYLSETLAGSNAPNVRVAGTLTWLSHGQSRYRLAFGVPKRGKVVQVPYPPYNWRAFNERDEATPIHLFPRMQIRPQQPLEGKIDFLEDRALVASYYVGPDGTEAALRKSGFTKPFFYPVNGPGGISLTEFGKPHDPTGSHAHHCSLWIAHANVDGQDFWAKRDAMISHQGFADLEDGPVFCRAVQKTVWTSAGTNLLNETRQLTFYRSNTRFRLLDIGLEFKPPGDKAIVLGKTSFGFLAARVAQSMSPFDGGGEIRNSRGDQNEGAAHLQHAEWIDQSGPVSQGAWAGVAMLDHPENVNHPTGWHCRNDGWAGASFNSDEPYTIEPGQVLRLRYRLVLHTGNSNSANLASRYREFVARPEVQPGVPKLKRKVDMHGPRLRLARPVR